jgi:hypothetical protein
MTVERIKKVTIMPITVIRKIPGRDILSQWTEGIKESLEQTFTVIIRPEGRFLTSRKDRRNHILKMLERRAGNESSEEWIELIRSARTVSPLGKAADDDMPTDRYPKFKINNLNVLHRSEML